MQIVVLNKTSKYLGQTCKNKICIESNQRQKHKLKHPRSSRVTSHEASPPATLLTLFRVQH